MDDLDKQAVVDALSAFAERTQDIIDRISGRKSLSTLEKNAVKALYRSLKGDLKAMADRALSDERLLDQTDRDRSYYYLAVLKASAALRAKTNTHPITSNWESSLMDVEEILRHYLYLLEVGPTAGP